MDDRNDKNKCDWCRGCGYILEDHDAYFYYGAEYIHNANQEKTKEGQRRWIDRAKALKGVPMQPLAVECPKCHGSGIKTQEV